MTGKDLAPKSGPVEQSKFEYLSLSKIFNERVKEADKKVELLKRLKTVEHSNKEQLKTIKDQEENQKK